MEYIDQNIPEQVDVLPIEVPLSPQGNGHILHTNSTVDCDLPGTPMRSDGTLRLSGVETVSARNSMSENEMVSVSSKETELSETSSNVSGESNLLLLSNKPAESSRGSAKRKRFFNPDNCRSDQMDVELRVIHNKNVFDQDNSQTASC